MTVVVTHTTPADGTFSATGAAAWDATHTLSGVGTMAEQNANNVAITGGTISGVTLPAGGSTLQVQYNNAGAIAGMSGTSWDDTNRSLTVTGATVTTSNPVLNLSQTWNAAGVTFTGAKINVTDTASNSSSLLMDLQVGGTSFANITKSGVTTFGRYGVNGAYGFQYDPTTNGRVTLTRSSGGGIVSTWDAGANSFSVGTVIGVTTFQVGSSSDLFMTRRAAANLRFGAADAAAPVAQTLSVQSVVAGTTNTAGANLTITGSQGTGTGAGGSIVFQVAPAGSTGTAQNALVDALTIASTQTYTFGSAPSTATTLRFGGPNYFVTATRASSTLDVGVSGDSRLSLDVGGPGFVVAGRGYLAWSGGNGATLSGASELILLKDAANTLAQRNGVNAQTFRLYNTYTDASNYERVRFSWASNVAYIKPENAGTGSARLLVLSTGTTVVSSLPAAATAGAGARAFVTDATMTMTLGVGTVVAGGGANSVPVYSDASNWLIG